MIRNFSHRGLQRLFERGDRGRIRPDLVDKVERILARLDASSEPRDMEAPGFGLHPMKGDLKSFWASGYSQMKKEVAGRYPRHPWPDDPKAWLAAGGKKP